MKFGEYVDYESAKSGLDFGRLRLGSAHLLLAVTRGGLAEVGDLPSVLCPELNNN